MSENPNVGSNSEWSNYIAPFCGAIGKTQDEVTEALKGLAGEPGQSAIDVLASEEFSPFEDIVGALASLKVAKGILKKAVQQHLRKTQTAATSTATPTT